MLLVSLRFSHRFTRARGACQSSVYHFSLLLRRWPIANAYFAPFSEYHRGSIVAVKIEPRNHVDLFCKENPAEEPGIDPSPRSLFFVRNMMHPMR